jgi:orotate phosphoribosyltransferase-like protein
MARTKKEFTVDDVAKLKAKGLERAQIAAELGVEKEKLTPFLYTDGPRKRAVEEKVNEILGKKDGRTKPAVNDDEAVASSNVTSIATGSDLDRLHAVQTLAGLEAFPPTRRLAMIRELVAH